MYGRGVEVDIETVADTLEHLVLVGIVVARVDNAYRFWPALLGCTYCSPEDSLAAASCITAQKLAELSIYSVMLLAQRRNQP
jgi:hypothetical protein